MTDDNSLLLRIVAVSASKAGDLIVEDADGNRRLFIGSTGTLSRGSLNPDFVEALLRRQRWDSPKDDHWYTLEELQTRFTERGKQSERTGAHRLVAALGGRSR